MSVVLLLTFCSRTRFHSVLLNEGCCRGRVGDLTTGAEKRDTEDDLGVEQYSGLRTSLLNAAMRSLYLFSGSDDPVVVSPMKESIRLEERVLTWERLATTRRGFIPITERNGKKIKKRV